MRLLAIDPGNKETAFVLMDEQYTVLDKGKVTNDQMIAYIWHNARSIDHVVVEMIASYGMAVGAEVFETCVMIGKIERTAEQKEIEHSRVFRSEEKLCICKNSRAKDSNIRAGLIERFAKFDKKRGTGTKTAPDHFYGVSKDMWAAFAVGVVYLDGINGLFTRKGDV